MNSCTTRPITEFILLIPFLFALTACGGGGSSQTADNGAAPSSTARSSLLPVNDSTCPDGGILVETGIDDNKNGILDDNEVDNSEKVCNGTAGKKALVTMSDEPIGANCPYRGIRIDSGIDSNSNNVLDASEITGTRYVCNLIDGSLGWQNATAIETDNTGAAAFAQIATDMNGNALAVWTQTVGIQTGIWANRYVPGSGWGNAELIQTDTTGAAFEPYIAVNANGTAFAVWRQSGGAQFDIWANRYVPGSGWGSAELIETNTGTALDVRVAIDASGNALAIWHQINGTRDIWANRYLPGFGWGTAELIETDNAGDATGPNIAFDMNGNALAVWRQSDGTRINIWANRYTPGGGWGSAELIETDNAGNALSPQIAVDMSGNALAVWRQSDGTLFNIQSNRYTLGSGWGSAELVETDNAGTAAGPDIAFDTSGNALAVWQQSDGTRFNIRANRYTPGSGWGSAESIETDNAGDALFPQVSIDSNGNALAVWYQSDSARDNIWANRYTLGTGWGLAQLIEADNAGDANEPQVAFDTSGNALAVWTQSDGTVQNILSNRWVAP